METFQKILLRTLLVLFVLLASVALYAKLNFESDPTPPPPRSLTLREEMIIDSVTAKMRPADSLSQELKQLQDEVEAEKKR